MSSIRHVVLLAVALVPLTACASHDAAQESAAVASTVNSAAPESKPEAKPAEDNTAKIKGVERRMAMTKARLAVAELEMANFEIDLANKLAAAEAELTLAQQKLDQFDKVDLPQRIAQADLSMLRGKDRAQEAADELKQIELMYKDQDLNDMTAEFVVSRGKRNAERTMAQIKLDEAGIDTMKKLELPRERRRLELDLIAKKNAFESAKRDSEVQRKNKQIGLMSVQNELAGIEEEMAKLSGPKP